VHPINSDNGVNEMTTKQINNFKPEDVINWNTKRPYDDLGQTMSVWRDPELVRKGLPATIFFVDGSRGISEVIDWDDDNAPRQDRRVSIQDHVMRIYDMDTVSRRATMDNDGEEWVILDLINEVNQEYRESLKG
tara:strand:- start:82 stop:483 length:402 start_codon:yes stop_codon:yes gene_type:complete